MVIVLTSENFNGNATILNGKVAAKLKTFLF